MTIKVLKKFIEEYAEKKTDAKDTTNTLNESKKEFVETIETQFKLIDGIILDLQSYMKFVERILNNLTQEVIEAINEKETFGNRKILHQDHITFRLQLFGSLIENSQNILKVEHLDQIWDILITNNRIAFDHQHVYKFMRMICDAVLKQQIPLINENDLISFITRRINSSQANFVELSMEGYHFFQTFFILMNKKSKKLILLGDDGVQQTQKMTSYNNQTGPQFKTYKFNQQDTTTISDPTQVEVMVKAPPNEMEGIQGLWKIAIDCRDTKVGESVTQLLLQLYTNLDFGMEKNIPQFEDQFVSSCLQIITEQLASVKQRTAEESQAILKRLSEIKGYYIRQQTIRMLPVQEKRIIKCLTYIQMLIKNAEKDGTFGIRPHSALVQGNFLNSITVNNSYKTSSGHRLKFQIAVYSNITVYELKSHIAYQIAQIQQADGTFVMEVPPHPQNLTISRYLTSTTLKDIDNGSTLAELRFRSNETLTVSHKSIFAASKVPLFNEEGTDINERAVFIFDQMFHTYCVDDVERPGIKIMAIQQVCNFVSGATNEQCLLNDKRATDILSKYDSNQDGKLERDDFIEFYRQSCFSKIVTVRQNLFKYNYNQQLRLMPKDGQDDNILQPRTLNDMPRFKIAKDDACFDTLFNLLELHKEVQIEAQSLIEMLCTKPSMFYDILWLDDRPKEYQQINWKTILQDPNFNKIRYALTIVDALITTDLAQINPNNYDYNYRYSWSNRFLEQGGFLLLINLFMRINEKQDLKDDLLLCLLEQVLRIIQIFIKAAINADLSEQERLDQKAKKQSEPSKTQSDFQVEQGSTQVQIPFVQQDTIGPMPPPTVEIKTENITQEVLFGPEKPQENVSKVEVTKIDTVQGYQFEDSNRFTQIVNEIRSNNYQAYIYSAVDFTLLQSMILSIINKLNLGHSKKEENAILINSLELWTSLVQKQPCLIDEFYLWKDGEVDAVEFIRSGIYSYKAESIRQAYQHTFEQIAEKITTNKGTRPLFYLLDLMLKSFPTLVTAENKDKSDRTSKSNEFFGLFTKLIELVNKEGAGDQPFDLRQMLVNSINGMKTHVSNEKGSIVDDDRTLVGYITLVQELLTLYIPLVPYEELVQLDKEHNLLFEMFYENLYYVPGKSTSQFQNKCKGRNSRVAGYRLLLKYLKALKPKELVLFLKDDLMPMIQDHPKPDKWFHQPSNKSRYMYSGIVNLGCICYMISMLQQFFMVPQFRYLLLKAVDQSEVKMGEWKGRQIQDNLLIQFQRLFGYLEMTDKSAFDPTDFIFAYKDFDGKPTNVAIQCDCQEFVNFFFDRIESLLEPTSQKYLVQDLFQFNQINERVCSKCGNRKSDVGKFYFLSVSVENQHSLSGSLEKLIQTSEIQDYMCGNCNQKVDLSERVMLRDTPNVLLVHLKRIVFSFDTFNNVKINSKLEFPHILDLRPYSLKGICEKEGTTEAALADPQLAPYLTIDDDQFIYKLVGVTVHQGTADHGHYYSIINTARGKDEHDPYTKSAEWLAVEKDSWKEFNDEEVKFFSFRDLAKEAFGNEVSNFNTKEQGFGKSAYMLVYERKKKTDIRQIVDGQETLISYNTIPRYVPEWLSNQVTKDNINFVIDRQVFDENFFTMVKQIFEHVSNTHVMNQHQYSVDYYSWFDQLKEVTLNLGHRVVFDFLSRFNEKKQLPAITDALCTVLVFTESHITYCSTTKPTTLILDFIKKYFLADGCKNLFELLFVCGDQTARMYIAKFTAKLINRAFIIYGVLNEGKDQGHPRLVELYTALHDLMQIIMYKLLDSECHKNWSRLMNYFTMLLEIATGGKYQTLYMLENYNFVVDICDVMLQDKSPKAALSAEKRVSMGGSVSTTPFGPLVALLSHLVRSMHTKQMMVVEEPGVVLETHTVFGNETKVTDDKKPLSKRILMSDEAVEYLTNPDLFNIVMNNNYQEEAFGKALAHVCFDNQKLSKKICKRLLKLIVFSDYSKIKPCIEIVNILLSIKDRADPALQRKRLEWILGFGFLKWAQKEEFKVLVGLETSFHNIKEEMYMMKSMLTYDPENDNSLLHLLWRYQGRMDQYTVSCLDDLTKVMAKDEVIRNYLAAQPGPTYQYARFTDWIKPYLEAQLKNSTSSTFATDTYHTNMKDATTRVLKQFEAYEQHLNQIDGTLEDKSNPSFISCNPQPYIILKQGSNENYLPDMIDKDELFLTISYVNCDYVWSQPTGVTNTAIGQKYLNKYTPSAGSKSAQAMLNERNNMISGIDSTRQNQDSVSIPQESEEQKNALDDSFDNWDGSEIHSCDDLIYKFTLNNNTQSPINFKIKLAESDIPANLHWPRTGIKGQLDVNEVRVVCILTKIRPDLPAFADGMLELEKLKIDLSWKLNEVKLKQIASQNVKEAKSAPGKQGATIRFDDKVDTIQSATQNEIQTQTGSGIGDGSGVQGDYFSEYFAGGNEFEKPCSACTVINPIDSTICYLCQTPF